MDPSLDPSAIRVVLHGRPPPEWRSLCRTYRLYLEGLRQVGFQVIPDEGERGYAWNEADAIIGFWGSSIWARPTPPSIARIACLHGGAIVDFSDLRALLSIGSRVHSLILNCTSDISLIRSLRLERCPEPQVLPLPVDVSRFRPMPKLEARRMLGIDGDAIVLGFVGRLLPQKGLHYFLQTVDYCRSHTSSNLIGLVVGDFWPEYQFLNPLGSLYRPYIAGLVWARGLQEHLRFRQGDLDDERLSACYGALDVLVHPTVSPDENFGYVPLEALACRRPVVSTAYGGLKDTIARLGPLATVDTWVTRNGVRFDLRGLRLRSLRLLMRPAQAESIASRGFALVRDDLSFSGFATRLRKIVIDAVLRARRDRGTVAGACIQGDRTWTPRPTRVMSWADIEPGVRHYVSTDVKAGLRSARHLYRWEGVHDESACLYYCEDPAWPCVAHLDGRASSVLSRMPSRGSWRQDAVDLSAWVRLPIAQLHHLAESGVVAWSGYV